MYSKCYVLKVFDKTLPLVVSVFMRKRYFGAMERQTVMFALKYFDTGAQDRRKPAIIMEEAPVKKVLLYGRPNLR